MIAPRTRVSSSNYLKHNFAGTCVADLPRNSSYFYGLFTNAVVQGVNGPAKTSSGKVKAESLRDFLGKRVPQMAKQLNREQEPQYFRGRDAQDYLLAVGKEGGH